MEKLLQRNSAISQKAKKAVKKDLRPSEEISIIMKEQSGKIWVRKVTGQYTGIGKTCGLGRAVITINSETQQSGDGSLKPEIE